jgi:hypothetical protein
MRIDRFHQTWMGGSASAQRWLAAFVYYYNFQRPNQALDNRTPVEEVQNSWLDSATWTISRRGLIRGQKEIQDL